MKLRTALCLMSASFRVRVLSCVALATLPHHEKLDDKAVRATNPGYIGYAKNRLLLPGPDYKIFVATSVKFDEQEFDFAADAVKEVTGIRNITGGDDIISDDMRLRADDGEDEDEYAEGSKCYALLRMRPPSISYAEGFLVLSCQSRI
jgi:hypothetical protein